MDTLVLRWRFPSAPPRRPSPDFETYGDNQFVTPITAFPVLRNQEKYQFRYDVSGTRSAGMLPKFGVDFIHEPVLSGAFPGQAETTVRPDREPDVLSDQPRSAHSGVELPAAI